MRRPSASLVVALLAIVIATAGTASATTALITSHQIKNGTIRLVDISKKARNALHGQTGKTGNPGVGRPPGPPGTARRPGRRRTTRDARDPGTARGSGSRRQPRPLRLHRGEEQHGRRTARESRHRGRRLPRRGASPQWRRWSLGRANWLRRHGHGVRGPDQCERRIEQRLGGRYGDLARQFDDDHRRGGRR